MKTALFLALATCSLSALGAGPDLLPVKQITLDLANTIAMKTIEACRARTSARKSTTSRASSSWLAACP